jgi:hypothetical protein
MTESGLIIESLRQQLKARGYTYSDLAAHWKLSLSSVKRIMSGDDLSLQKIESACSLMSLPVADFYEQVQFSRNMDFVYMSVKQEEFLSKDARLLHFFMLLQESWNVSKILKTFSITQTDIQKYLIALDKNKLIQLLPHNKVKRLFNTQLRFRRDGPLAQQLRTRVKENFLESDFNKDNEHLSVLNISLTPNDFAELKSQFLKISRELSAQSDSRPFNPSAQEFGLIMALRPWTAPFMQALKIRNSVADYQSKK